MADPFRRVLDCAKILLLTAFRPGRRLAGPKVTGHGLYVRLHGPGGRADGPVRQGGGTGESLGWRAGRSSDHLVRMMRGQPQSPRIKDSQFRPA